MSLIKITQEKFSNFSFQKLSILAIFILAIIFSLTQTIDDYGKQHIDKAFNRALITFGIAKTLNGVISVAQGTEIAVQPAGIGVNLTPGQILDPINDLVERFSWIMLASTTSLGIQKIFLNISTWPTFNYFVIVMLVTTIILTFSSTKKHIHLREFVLKLSIILIILRFAVPISGIANEHVYSLFLENKYSSAAEQLESTTNEITQLNEQQKLSQPDTKKKSVWESAKAFYHSTSEMLDFDKKVNDYKEAAKESSEHIINLIAVFIFQTILIPIIFLFLMYYLVRYIINADLS